MSNVDFQTARDAAREWEVRAADWARGRGWFVLPTYDFSGAGDNKAPKLLAPPGADDLVLPDLQCFGDGQRWLEIKYKTSADVHRKTGNNVTGINLRLYNHYLAVQATTGAAVYVMFIHGDEGEVRGDALDGLRQYVHHTYDGKKMGRGGMVFWKYEAIPLWGPISMLDDSAAATACREASAARKCGVGRFTSTGWRD